MQVFDDGCGAAVAYSGGLAGTREELDVIEIYALYRLCKYLGAIVRSRGRNPFIRTIELATDGTHYQTTQRETLTITSVVADDPENVGDRAFMIVWPRNAHILDMRTHKQFTTSATQEETLSDEEIAKIVSSKPAPAGRGSGERAGASRSRVARRRLLFRGSESWDPL
ncbi:MAG TPA: hypothetical protein VHQ47_21145 [Phycisphaerae bacterium]|nr:hypothetical protein [Phycisphaerae bacterium]